MLTHGNLVSNTLATIGAFGIQPSDLRLCFLPLSHIFARTCDLYTWIARGSELGLAQSRETILHDCVRLGPTMLNGVPYFYERVHRYLVQQGLADKPGSLLRILGGQVRLCCCGGAALPDNLYDFWRQHGIPLLQGYGLTETSPVISLNSLSHERRGTVGRPVEHVEVRIADDDEVLVRGPNVMSGYWRDDEATRAIIFDGWLHTGDLGSLDADGYLVITGRKKDLIVTAAGKNIAPAYLERLLTEDPLIAQAVVIGDGRNYLTALIVPDPDELKSHLPRLRVLPLSKRWVLNHPRVRRMYRERIDERLHHVSRHEQVRRFYLMDRGFTPETGEMTPKLSLRRALIQQNCASIIERMYSAETDDASWPGHVVSYVKSWIEAVSRRNAC
jgi:long-chain acyl-CoA synthetase